MITEHEREARQEADHDLDAAAYPAERPWNMSTYLDEFVECKRAFDVAFPGERNPSSFEPLALCPHWDEFRDAWLAAHPFDGEPFCPACGQHGCDLLRAFGRGDHADYECGCGWRFRADRSGRVLREFGYGVLAEPSRSAVADPGANLPPVRHSVPGVAS